MSGLRMMRRVRGLAAARRVFAERARSPGPVLPDAVRSKIFEVFGDDLPARAVAARIIDDVRSAGDDAVRRYSAAFDGVELAFIEAPAERVRGALGRVPHPLREAIELSVRRVRSFQERALPRGWMSPDGELGETATPVASAGAYVPGGSAPLASTVIMTAVPARVAGVRQVILCSPAPGDTLPHPAILAAADAAGVDRVFKIGGAQAIAAMALGTETIPRVDIVCGPGNVFVTEAKRLLYGEVGIDGLYGPTETMVIADESADPELCAADLLAQAEHDPMATPVLVATSEEVADGVQRELRRQLEALPRARIARAAAANNGLAIVVATVEEAIEVANSMAPEHLCLAVADPGQYVGSVRNAGGVFLDEHSAEVMGDYVAGPSHVMPTGGTARFASALSVRNFVRMTPVVNLSENTVVETSRHAVELARSEGLDGHARAAELRLHRLAGE